MQRGQEVNEGPVRSHMGTRTAIRSQCSRAEGRCFQLGPIALVHRGHEFHGAPSCSNTGPGLEGGPSALVHRGRDFNEALVRICIAAMISMRP